MNHPQPLSRRAFLKLSEAASLGLALSACGLTQKTNGSGTATTISPPTTTSTPTPQPAPTLKLTATPTEIQVVINFNDWASYTSGDRKGTINLDVMRIATIPALQPASKTVDLQIAEMRLAAVTDQDVSQLSAVDLERVRRVTTQELESSQVFVDQVKEIRTKFIDYIANYKLRPKNDSGLRSVTLVAAKNPNGQYGVSRAVVEEKDSIRRFNLAKDGTLLELPTKLTWREVGECVGINIGESPIGNNPYGDSNYQEAMGKHFSMLQSGAYMAHVLGIWGTEQARMFRRLTKENRQINKIGPVFWNAFLPYELKGASKEEIDTWVDRRIREILTYMASLDEKRGEKPVYVMLGNEFLVWIDPRDNSVHLFPNASWANPQTGASEDDLAHRINPFEFAYGRDALKEMYVKFVRKAQQIGGLALGRDYRILYTHYNHLRPDVLYAELDQVKEMIAQELGIQSANVQLDVDIEVHSYLNDKERPFFDARRPSDEELIHAIEIYQQIGRVHLSDVNILGAKTQQERVEELKRILGIALRKGCDSIAFWKILRPKGHVPSSEKDDYFNNQPMNIFDRNYEPIPGNGYDEIIDELIQFGEEKGLL